MVDVGIMHDFFFFSISVAYFPPPLQLGFEATLPNDKISNHDSRLKKFDSLKKANIGTCHVN